MKYKVVKPFIDQDTKQKHNPDELYTPFSDFEKGRHLAEGNIIPIDNKKIERSVKKPTEKRKYTRRKKHGSETDNASN